MTVKANIGSENISKAEHASKKGHSKTVGGTSINAARCNEEVVIAK